MCGQINDRQANADQPTTGVRNPERPEWWLVRPWPPGAGFCAVVRHFLTAYFHIDRGVAHQLAYFRGYQAALAAAPTDELTLPGDRQWHDELVSCIADCVAVFENKQVL